MGQFFLEKPLLVLPLFPLDIAVHLSLIHI